MNYKNGITLKKHYCKDCKKEITYCSIRCMSCANKGKRNPMFGRKGKNSPIFKHGRIFYCKCGNKMSFYAKQCQKCYLKTMKGKTNPNYNNHKLKGRANPNFGKSCQSKNNNYLGGYYQHIWMRSSWEIKFAKWLSKHEIEWIYEPKEFDLNNTTYTPDFYLPKKDIYIEIKGYWRDDARKKYKLFKKLYPKIILKIITDINNLEGIKQFIVTREKGISKVD